MMISCDDYTVNVPYYYSLFLILLTFGEKRGRHWGYPSPMMQYCDTIRFFHDASLT